MQEASETETMKRESAQELIKKVLPTYEVMEMIGEGSFGAVFRIRDSLKERAVKIIQLSATSSIDKSGISSGRAKVERDFRHLIESYEKIACNEIVTIHDFYKIQASIDDNQATAYALVVMELYPFNLNQFEVDYFKRNNRLLPAGTAQSLMEKLAYILDILYSRQGFLFEDLKPENLLLKESDNDIKMVAGDIGGLKRLRSVSTTGSQITLSYSAPEVIRKGHKPDIRSVIYSFGLISFFIIEGHVPYEDSEIVERIDLIKEDGLPFARTDIPDNIRTLISTCLSFEPENRYQTFGEVLDAVRGKISEQRAAFSGQTIDLSDFAKAPSSVPGEPAQKEPLSALKNPFARFTPWGGVKGAVTHQRSAAESRQRLQEQADTSKIDNELNNLVVRTGDLYKIQNQSCKVSGDIVIEIGGTLSIENSKLFFASDSGIISSGTLKAKNVSFMPFESIKKWTNISLNLSGSKMNVLDGCRFRGCGGRTWGQIKTALRLRGYPLRDDYTYGGALFIAEAKEQALIINDCSFSNCSSYEGGAVYCLKSQPTIAHSTFDNCSASLTGAGISLFESTLSLKKCRLQSCTAGKEGGGMHLKSSSAIVDDCIFENCITRHMYGGGIYCSASSPTIKDCRFNRCIADRDGGAIFADRESRPQLMFPSFANCRPNNTNVGNY